MAILNKEDKTMLSKEQIMKLIPKSKQDGIFYAWEDSDGIWITLNEGWNADNMDYRCGVIHEGGDGDEEPRSEIMRHLRFQIKGIRKLTEEEME